MLELWTNGVSSIAKDCLGISIMKMMIIDNDMKIERDNRDFKSGIFERFLHTSCNSSFQKITKSNKIEWEEIRETYIFMTKFGQRFHWHSIDLHLIF